LTAGFAITVFDAFGSASQTNRLKIQRAGSDLIYPPAAASYELTSVNQGVTLYSDGVSKWYAVSFQPGAATNGTFPQQNWSGGIYAASLYTLPVSIGSTGKMLQSNGTNAVFSTPTWPTSGGTSGTIVRSNGSNFVNSTATYPDTGGTANKVLQSDGTNFLSQFLKGTTTNDSASAGEVGEVVSSLVASGSAVSLTTATAANITSISLTAGDWDVEGNINFTETTSTVTARSAGITTTSATVPTDGSEVYCGVQSTVTSEINSITIPRKRISIAGTTTTYLVGKATFSAGTCAGFGAIVARRVR